MEASIAGATDGVVIRGDLSSSACLDERTLRLLDSSRARRSFMRRGWLMRRLLLTADVVGLMLAFAATQLLVGSQGAPVDNVQPLAEFGVFMLTIPLWIAVAKLHGLYERDEERANHSTVQELAGVIHVVTLGAWAVFLGAWLTGVAEPNPPRLVVFWVLAIACIALARVGARTISRRHVSYLQNAIIVGAGDIGQLVARKLIHHREYGINVVGFVDAQPKDRRGDLGHVTVLGGHEQLPELIELFDVERVVVAFSNETEAQTVELIRSLRELNVHVDLVPRLFELVGPNVSLHDVEGLSLVGLPPVRLTRSSRVAKRVLDVTVAALFLVVTAPLFAYAAWRVRRESPGPIFFRQVRLGQNMRAFTALKFRTMHVDTDDAPHRAYIKATMDSSATVATNGMYKLERREAITPFGQWLRRTSLDELPQLVNVLRGDMSLVGPRPCIPYETEQFRPHHFERFMMPAGLTGLWQVKARAQSTFGEALDMDVVYARSWSLKLDLELLLRTPLALVRQRKVTA